MTQAEPDRVERQDPVRIERHGAVAIVTLDRPEGRNSFDVATDRALLRAVQRLEQDADVRAVIVQGTGKWFCTGADVAEMRENMDRMPDHFDDLTLPFHAMLAAIRASAKTYIAAVNGIAAGGGVGLALGCDLVIAARSARFIFAYANLGISPDGGTTAHLVRAAGPHRAREAFLLDEGLDAATLQGWGLVNRVVDDVDVYDAARQVAEVAAARAPRTVAETKRLVELAAHSSVFHTLEEERRAIMQSAGTADAREGVTAFFEKRRPQFRGA